MARKGNSFAVWVPDESGRLREKLERLARGSMIRTLGPTVAVLIADADEDAPQWRKSEVVAERGARHTVIIPEASGGH